MRSKDVKKRFEKYKKDLPKDSFCVILQDDENGLTNFMSYDTTNEQMVTTSYILVRGFLELLETQMDYVIRNGQAAIFRELEIMKPEVKDKMIKNSNVTVVDFKNDK